MAEVNNIKQLNKRVNFRWEKLTFRNTLLLDLTCVMWLCSMPLRSLFSKLLSPFGLSSYNHLFVGVLIFIPLFFYLVSVKRLPWKYFNFIFMACTGYFALTLLIHPEYEEWYARSIYGIMYSVFRPDNGALWAFLMVEISGTAERLWANLKIYAAIIGFYNLYLIYVAEKLGYWTAFNASGELVERIYSLDFGYEMMFVVLVALVCFYKKRNPLYLFVVAIATLLIFKYGSRGAFLCAIAFAIIMVLFQIVNKKRKVFAVATIVTMGIPFYINFNNILLSIALFLEDIVGISSRTITQILNKGMYDDSGRSAIYALAKEAIQNKPFLGYGAFGDRPIIGPSFYWGYPHSIFYEMLINFGVMVGISLLAIIIYRCFKLLLTCKNETMLLLFIIILSMDMRLLVSDTFWGNSFFWMTIAILFTGRQYCIGKLQFGRKRN